ncbi:cytochrome d ubiquinol oxidase subunit II [Mycobacterium sp. KBS0706]|uniref:cytochrome d ubiquinol oxidase subunit II n=1 Tax=Mycobacterium sp. KBS0706 TaxID=2578109 RepID=UPI00110FC17B|nr:cytochrome d ubiquinol oxidase subunit II [Mycobacterium sp. KBS0706]TSD84438.1 cytochrome d ubiquinol oxidase subunit II [Mycobacterium sp. KBS0706]
MTPDVWTIANALPLIWAAIAAGGVFMYVLMDGFDLGVGILFPWAHSEEDRDLMMNSVAPIWDGNETWLVLGGVILLAAFPAAFAIILPALYLPITFMVMGLIFRGVAFEFRFKAHSSKWLWTVAFAGGSLFATFFQGVVLGTFVQGFPLAGGHYAGGAFHWLSPFSLMTGVALVFGYGLIGAGWLVMKTEGALQAWARRTMGRLLLAVLVFMAVVSLWVPLLDQAISERWFTWPNIAYFAPVPILVVLFAWRLWLSLQRGSDYGPFLYTMALFVLGYTGLAISLFPRLVPPDLTIWDAAAPASSQLFLLVGVLFLIPVILVYTTYSYWVFRGKVRPGEGYDH